MLCAFAMHEKQLSNNTLETRKCRVHNITTLCANNCMLILLD